MGQSLAGVSSQLPLCVDLDGTLIKSDLLVEAALKLLSQNPFYFFQMLLWLLQGRSVLKDELAKRVTIEAELLPYRPSVISFLQEQQKSGRELILVTASHKNFAIKVYEHLGLFSELLATDRENNLRGESKAQVLADKYGQGSFCYVGDSSVDLPVWKMAGTAIVVSDNEQLAKKASAIADIETTLEHDSDFSWSSCLKALRPHQWVKNLLLFIPAIMGQQIFEASVLFAALRAFIAFSLCASAVYVLNDLSDLDSDRVHSKKSKRPFAAGDLSPFVGLKMIPMLLLVAGLLALTLPKAFNGILVLYFVTTTFYSFTLKQKAIVDILTLATLYTLRIFAGSCATSIVISPWLLAFSLFMFLSLASVKRFSELIALQASNKDHTPGRGYLASDLPLIGQSGLASGYIAVLVLALYINSPDMMKFYSNGMYLWGLCLPILYWITRVWLLAHRGEMNEDPILFAISDFPSYLVGAISIIILLLAV